MRLIAYVPRLDAIARNFISILFELAAAGSTMSADHPLLHMDHNLRSPLHCAAVTGRTAVIRELVRHGHPADVVDRHSHTPWWYAEFKGFVEAETLLRIS